MKTFAIAACLAAGLLAPGAASAVTYDAFTSFNGLNNPAGGFFYNSATGPTTATPLTTSAACPLDSLCLVGGPDSAVFKATATTPTSFFDPEDSSTTAIPHDRLLVDPGDFATAILFFAPTAGLYTFDASFTALASNANGITVLRLSGTPMGPPPLVQVIGSPNFIPNNFTFTESRTLAAGDFYGFRIGSGLAVDGDITGFSFQATTAPEPTTWALMLMGFGGLGAALRRRRALALA